MAFIFEPAIQPATDVNGDRISGAYWRFCLAGTTTATSVYSDEALSTPLTNPVVADSAGEFVQIYLDPDVSYRATLFDANDVQLTDVDDYDITVPSTVALLATLAGTGGAALIGTSTGETVEERLGRTAFGIGLFTSFVGTPPEIDSAVKTVYTDGYASYGVGIARYIYDAAVDSAFVTSYPKVSFLADDGRGFRLDHEQRLTIEMFGGVGYATQAAAEAGTDILAALQAYEAYNQFLPNTGANEEYFPYVPDLHLGAHFYYSSSWEARANVRVKGLATGHNNSGVPAGTVWVHPDDTTAIIFANTNTTGDTSDATVRPTAQGSLIEGISFKGGGTDTTVPCIWMRTVATLRDCGFYSVPGTAIFMNATATSGGSTEGNANTWRVEDCVVHSAGLHGFHCTGSDVNAGTIINFHTHECGGCGILDESGLGNNYFGMHIAGYGNEGVHHGGRLYFLVSNTAGAGSSTTPGTNNSVWYDHSSGSVSASFPAWSALDTYTLKLPIAVFGASNKGVVTGIYVEGSAPCHIQGVTVAIGGQTSFTRQSPHLNAVSTATGIFSNVGIGGRIPYTTGSAGEVINGDYCYAAVGTPEMLNGADYGVNILEHRREIDGELSWYWAYSGKDTVYRFMNQKFIWRVTGPSTTVTFGRSAGVPYMLEVHGLALCDPADTNNSRVIWCGTGPPASGNHARGEIVFNRDPSASGTFAWVCVTSGTPGTWKAVTGIAA